MVAVAYKRWALTRGIKCSVLTARQNGLLVSGRLREVIAYARWSHREVQLYIYISILAYPLKGSTTIALGSCKPVLNSVNLFPPSSSATSIMLNPPSVQYIFLPTQSIAIPSGVCTSDIRTSTFPVMENTTREHVKTKQRTVNCVSNTKSMQTPANKLEPRVYELSQTPGMVTHRLSALIKNQACFWSLLKRINRWLEKLTSWGTGIVYLDLWYAWNAKNAANHFILRGRGSGISYRNIPPCGISPRKIRELTYVMPRNWQVEARK